MKDTLTMVFSHGSVWWLVVFCFVTYGQESNSFKKDPLTGRLFSVYNPCLDTVYLKLQKADWESLSEEQKSIFNKLKGECEKSEYNQAPKAAVRFDEQQLFSQLGSFHIFMGGLTILGAAIYLNYTARQDFERKALLYAAGGGVLMLGFWEFKLGFNLKKYAR